ncbi:MAG: pseudaminic acid synthase [Alphaproteobacteria bacterium]|nr:pseudaminic acid synthase [Alphaproteobacteria bacterium]
MRNFKIGNRSVGAGHPCYIIAEISCNHEGNLEEARGIIEAAAKAGCDAVKIQTYTADTITRDFKTKPKGTIWENLDLHGLYKKASTPWEWHGELQKTADAHGLHLFSSPFDETAVDFLEEMNAPVYKIASFEIVDTKLLEKVAKTRKPVIISSGMSTYMELREAFDTLRAQGASDIAILKCNSGYPGEFAEANLRTIPVMEELFGCVVGLSDHIIFADSQIENCRKPFAHITPLEAVKLGAKIVEVHLTLDREKARGLMENNEGGFDWPFSRTPAELKQMVDAIRAFERGEGISYTEEESALAVAARGEVRFDPTPKEEGSRSIRPSLWVVEDIKKGEVLRFSGGERGNFDSIRPGGGLHIRYADVIEGKPATRDLKAGEPLEWGMVGITRQ